MNFLARQRKEIDGATRALFPRCSMCNLHLCNSPQALELVLWEKKAVLAGRTENLSCKGVMSGGEWKKSVAKPLQSDFIRTAGQRSPSLWFAHEETPVSIKSSLTGNLIQFPQRDAAHKDVLYSAISLQTRPLSYAAILWYPGWEHTYSLE